MKRVLVGCEFSGTVRDAFRNQGWEAWSCDLLPCDADPEYHLQGDVFAAIEYQGPWDLGIFHPPCTHLAVSGARHFPAKIADGRQQAALRFVERLLDAPIPSICLENPISIISSKIRKPDQIIQPWMFGHGETKATCLWLKNLPKLTTTNVVAGREGKMWKLPPSANRWKLRSKTYPGIAEAMGLQWSAYLNP